MLEFSGDFYEIFGKFLHSSYWIVFTYCVRWLYTCSELEVPLNGRDVCLECKSIFNVSGLETNSPQRYGNFHFPYLASHLGYRSYKGNKDKFVADYEMDHRIYRGADMSLARPTSRCILFDGENISFDASLVTYINSTNIPPIMIINRIYKNQNLLSL